MAKKVKVKRVLQKFVVELTVEFFDVERKLFKKWVKAYLEDRLAGVNGRVRAVDLE